MDETINNASEWGTDPFGKNFWYDADDRTIVIQNPDGRGTMFQLDTADLPYTVSAGPPAVVVTGQ